MGAIISVPALLGIIAKEGGKRVLMTGAMMAVRQMPHAPKHVKTLNGVPLYGPAF